MFWHGQLELVTPSRDEWKKKADSLEEAVADAQKDNRQLQDNLEDSIFKWGGDSARVKD